MSSHASLLTYTTHDLIHRCSLTQHMISYIAVHLHNTWSHTSLLTYTTHDLIHRCSLTQHMITVEASDKESHSQSYSMAVSHSTTKPTKWPVCPAKTRIRMGIHPVWSESSLFVWRSIGSLATHWAYSEDWPACADVLSLRLVHRSFCWFCHVLIPVWMLLKGHLSYSSVVLSHNVAHFFSKVWEYYLEVCNDHNSFFGMTWPHLKSLLNNVEMTKTYILNPLAPEFIPKSIYPHGQPVFMSPGHSQGAPGLYHPTPRSIGPGHPYQQVCNLHVKTYDVTNEPRNKKTCLLGFPTRYDSNQQAS